MVWRQRFACEHHKPSAPSVLHYMRTSWVASICVLKPTDLTALSTLDENHIQTISSQKDRVPFFWKETSWTQGLSRYTDLSLSLGEIYYENNVPPNVWCHIPHVVCQVAGLSAPSSLLAYVPAWSRGSVSTTFQKVLLRQSSLSTLIGW